VHPTCLQGGWCQAPAISIPGLPTGVHHKQRAQHGARVDRAASLLVQVDCCLASLMSSAYPATPAELSASPELSDPSEHSPQLEVLDRPRELGVHRCSDLVEFLVTFQHRLQRLQISECPQLEVVDLSGLVGLRQLGITGCSKRVEVRGLSLLTRLEVLELKGCSNEVVSPSSQHVGLFTGLTSCYQCGCRHTRIATLWHAGLLACLI
jgi:hypothetical protein